MGWRRCRVTSERVVGRWQVPLERRVPWRMWSWKKTWMEGLSRHAGVSTVSYSKLRIRLTYRRSLPFSNGRTSDDSADGWARAPKIATTATTDKARMSEKSIRSFIPTTVALTMRAAVNAGAVEIPTGFIDDAMPYNPADQSSGC